MAEDSSSKEPIAKLGAWLAGGQAVFVGALTAIGVASGNIQRILRNSPEEAALWLAFVAVGIVSGVIVANTATAGAKMHADHLILALLGVSLMGTAGLWDYFEIGTEGFLSGNTPVVLTILAAVISVLAALVMFFSLWIIADRERNRLLTTWWGLLVFVISTVWALALWGWPSYRTLIALIGIALLAWAVGLSAEQGREAAKAQEPEPGTRAMTALLAITQTTPPDNEQA